MVATATIAILAPRLHFELGAASALLPVANFLFSLILATALFATVYKVLPDIDLEWSDVVVGAAVTALLYEIGQLLIGFYLEQRSGLPAYGATGGTIILLLWIYYSTQIFLLGAEFTRAYATRHSPAGRFQSVEVAAT
jgi:membrane protein